MFKVRPTQRRAQSCQARVKIFSSRGSNVYERPGEGNAEVDMQKNLKSGQGLWSITMTAQGETEGVGRGHITQVQVLLRCLTSF